MPASLDLYKKAEVALGFLLFFSFSFFFFFSSLSYAVGLCCLSILLFNFLAWPHGARGILVPRPGIRPTSPALET